MLVYKTDSFVRKKPGVWSQSLKTKSMILTVASGKSFYTSGSFINYSDVNVITISNLYYSRVSRKATALLSKEKKKVA